MTLTRYGWPVWGPLTVIGVVLAGLCAVAGWWWGIPPVALLWLAQAWFFRDVERSAPRGLPPGAMISPSDGRISALLRVDHHEATGGPALIVRTFLSVLDVHVNRVPAAGEVVALSHRPGQFFDARSAESAQLNESNLITLRLGGGETIGVRQVAGKVARRIVCQLRVGDHVEAGERFGMIRFGSTTELILPRPADVEVLVAVGDRVAGGRTPLAVLRPVAAAPAGPDRPSAAGRARSV
jgi:phosphatidylserine decarboxylase